MLRVALHALIDEAFHSHLRPVGPFGRGFFPCSFEHHYILHLEVGGPWSCASGPRQGFGVTRYEKVTAGYLLFLLVNLDIPNSKVQIYSRLSPKRSQLSKIMQQLEMISAMIIEVINDACIYASQSNVEVDTCVLESLLSF